MKSKLTKLLTVPTLIAVILTSTAFGFRPIFHPPTISILDALRHDPDNFSILIGLIKESGLDELTEKGMSFTLLAPTNAAFAKLPSGTLESFRKDKSKLRKLLFNHLVSGKVLIEKVSPANGTSEPCLINPQSFTSLNGTSVEIGCKQGTNNVPFVNGDGRVLESNFEGNSAAIHVIDTVLSAIGVDSGLTAIGSFFDIPARTDVASGLSTTTFDTLNGTVTVNLPDDLAAGDTISGTVIAEPKGKTGDEQAKNQDELSGYVVEVAEQSTPKEKVTGNLIDLCKDPAEKTNDYSLTICSKWSVPDAVKTVAVVLKNREGKIVSRADVPVAPKANPAKVTEGLLTPAVGQAGKPISVKGPFDGDFTSTAIKLGNQTAKFLASSPRKVVVQNPANSKGPADIEVEYKGKTVAKCTYRSVSVKLAADKLNLTKGEQTTLTVTLAGLIGLLTPVSVQLSNKSPGTVSMGGGETQTINVDPAQVNGDIFSTKRTLTGVSAGGFSINAVVQNGGLSICSPGNGGNIPMGPIPQPSPGDNPTPRLPLDSGGNPRDNDGPGHPVVPFQGRFRVTLNGFTANHVTYRGVFQRPDVVTFFPRVQTFDVAGAEGVFIGGGSTGNIGQTPDNPIQGGSSGTNGGFRDGDGFPTQTTPWRRTVPFSRFPPGTIPPTVYFEGPLVQNTHAAIIIPNIWSANGVNGNRDSNDALQRSYQQELIRARAELRASVLGMFTRPPAFALSNFLKPGSSMGIRNTMTVPYGVPQTRPVGLQAIGREFGFTPQVLVLTYESADYMSRTDFGFGIGVVPVRYVDHPSFAGDYMLYLQVERMDTMAPCADPITGSRYTGTAELRTSRPRAQGPYNSEVNLTVNFTECRGIMQITSFPPLISRSDTELGPNTSTMTMVSGGSGRFTASTGRLEMPITLGLQNSLSVFGNSTLPMTLIGTIDRATGTVTLRGTGTFSGGQLGTYQGTIVVTGTFSPRP